MPTNFEYAIQTGAFAGLPRLVNIEHEVASLSGVVRNVKDSRFAGGAKGGTAIDTVPFQAAIDTGGAVVVPPGTYNVPGLTLKPGVDMFGFGYPTLVGTAGVDTMTVQASADKISLSGLVFSGGENQLVSNAQFTTNVRVTDCDFNSPVSAGIHVVGAIERWYLTDVRGQGGKYFYKHDNTAVSTANYIDKTHFLNCRVGGQTINGFRIEVDLANDVTFTNLNLVSTSQHGFYAAGGLRALTFINPNTEGIGQSGKENRTTLSGVVAATATSATLASASGWATGDGMTIAGAGGSGADFTILSVAQGGPGVTVSGTTVSWTGGTSTTVANPDVTNAEWDEFVFTNIGSLFPARVQFLGGKIGGSGSGGHLRYAIYYNAFNLNLYGTEAIAAYPIYDPGCHVRCYGYDQNTIRQGLNTRLYQKYDDAVIVKAGTPSDASFESTPKDGTVVGDSTGSKIWIRLGGTWKSVVVA